MATISLALFMWKRIKEIGIESVMGVPGDFNMAILDDIYKVDGLNWVGNSNELNAAYAADGYARVKGTPGCVVTTHGVGELSAINGIAGAMSEHVPVIHVVGQTTRAIQDNHMMIHHSIGTKPDHQMYNKTSRLVRCSAAELWDPQRAPAEIDRVLRECSLQQLPVYIFFPLDLAGEQVPARLLEKPIDLSPPVNTANEEQVFHAIIDKLAKAKNPALFADHLAIRHARSEAREFVAAVKLPVYVAHMGRGILDEDSPYFVGLHNGEYSYPGIFEAAEEVDFLLTLGWWPVDTNTGGFTRNFPPEKRVDLMDGYAMIEGKRVDGVYMAPLLTKLIHAVGNSLKLASVEMPKVSPRPELKTRDPSKITHKFIWPRLSKFLREGDVIISDTGTATFGWADGVMPKNVIYINQTYYGSIGYATPAAFGADVALGEHHAADKTQPRRRTLLFTGDGSLQLTIQEVGTMVTHGLQPIIFVINNAGYTIEKAIHGASMSYNDINAHNYRYLLHLYKAKNPDECFHRAATPEELETVLEKLEKAGEEYTRQVQIVEVMMDALDIPWRLRGVLEKREGMKRYLEDEGFHCS